MKFVILLSKVAATAAEFAFSQLGTGETDPSELESLFTAIRKHEENCYASIDEVCIPARKLLDNGRTCG